MMKREARVATGVVNRGATMQCGHTPRPGLSDSGDQSSTLKSVSKERPLCILTRIPRPSSPPPAHHGQDLFAGYVPVAPGQALSYTADTFAAVKGVPALIVYGEMDRMGTKASSLLQAMPDSRVLMIPGASHPCYLDEPELFHKELLSFLREDAAFSRHQRKLSAGPR